MKGLTDSQQEGLFRWTDGRPMIFASWANKTTANASQPDGGELEDCALIRLTSLSAINQWHDVPCALNDVKQFICKWYSQDNEAIPRGSPAILTPSEFINYNTTMEAPPPHIRKNLFQCANEEYIHKTLRCDGIDHCREASDELNCSSSCPKESFQCTDGQCVDISYYCDYKEHCLDGSDEKNCESYTCQTGEFMCMSGQCIKMSQRCDLIKHCADGSDELNCLSCRRPDTFQCFDGQCLPWHARCDGVKDCSGCNDEDEALCFWSVFTACSAYSNLECTVDPKTGSGDIILKHDFDGDLTKYHNILDGDETNDYTPSLEVPVTYLAPSTYNEIQAILTQSDTCTQAIAFKDKSCIEKMSWTSLNLDSWKAVDFLGLNDSSSDENTIVVIRDKHALPVIDMFIAGEFCMGQTLQVDPVICSSSLGVTAGSEMTCRNNQKVPAKYKCIFEFDVYGIQRGCRDMSHLDSCGALEPLVECLTTVKGGDYKGFQSVTVSGIICQRWDMQVPHSHAVTALSLEVLRISDANNYCRNPGEYFSQPYCVTSDPTQYTDACDIPLCEPGEKDLRSFECMDDYFKCPGDYCIPFRYVCDGEWHCADGEDEHECDCVWCLVFGIHHQCCSFYTN